MRAFHYWFEGQDPSTQAITDTAPGTLLAADWETYAVTGKPEAKLIVQAVGPEDICKASSLVQLKLSNYY